MNEVTIKQSPGLMPAAPASSKVADSVRDKVVDTAARPKPAERVEEKSGNVVAESAASLEQVSQAVAQMNEFVQNEQRDLQFSVHEATGTMVVQVTDRNSGELIRQIPNEDFLRLAEHANRNEQVNLINALG